MPDSSARRQPAPAADSSKSRETREQRESKLFFPTYSWPKEFTQHRARLSRGVFQLGLLDLIRQRTEGRRRKEGEPVPEWCWPFSTKDAAADLGCSDSEVRADLRDAERRGLIEYHEVGHAVECRLTCADSSRKYGLDIEVWEKLPSVKRAGPQLVKPEPAAESDEEPAPEDPVKEDPVKPSSTPVRRKIAAVRAGAAVKPAKVDRFVDEVELALDGPGEIRAELHWENRRLTVSASLTPNAINELRKESGSALPNPPKTTGLAEEVRARTGLVLDPPAVKRIERALNGTVPLPFYLDLLAGAAGDVDEPKSGLAIYVAEHQAVQKWRLSQKAGPPPVDKRKLSKFEQALAGARELENAERTKA